MKWRCSYCNRSTHTRRTCKFLRSDKEWLIRANIEFRKLAAELMISNGYAAGTLLEHIVPVYGEHDLVQRCPVLITHVDWEQINFTLDSRHTMGKAAKRNPTPHPFKLTYLKQTKSWSQASRIGLITNKELTPTVCFKMGGENKIPCRGMSIVSSIEPDRVKMCIPDNFYSHEAQEDFVNKYLNTNPDSFQERLKRKRSQICWTHFKWMDYEEVEKIRLAL